MTGVPDRRRGIARAGWDWTIICGRALHSSPSFNSVTGLEHSSLVIVWLTVPETLYSVEERLHQIRGKPQHEWWGLAREWLPLARGGTYDAVCGMKISAPAVPRALTKPSKPPLISMVSKSPMIDSEVMHRTTWKPRPDADPDGGTQWQPPSARGQSFLFWSAESVHAP